MLLPASHPAVHTLKSPRFQVVPEVAISTPSGGSSIAFEDVSHRLTALSLGNSINDTTASGVFTFSRGAGTDSLSPLMGRSTHRFSDRPILDPNCEVHLNAHILDSAGAEVGFFRWFTGRIDRVNVAASGTTISVQCRDLGAKYLNRILAEAQHFSSTVGLAVEAVMESILAANGFPSASELTVPVSPGFLITEFFTGDISVLESLRILAQQIGWDVRWFESGSGGMPPQGLRFYDPGRGRLLHDDFLDAFRYQAITELALDDSDLRNSWDVFYPDCVTPAHAEDAASIARYGLRYARIGEDRALNIRTLEAAQRLADAALADTKDPFASHELRMPIYPVVELNDLHLYQGGQVDANGVLLGSEYDNDLMLAVVGYRHDWKAGPGMPTTTIQARGQPIAAYREYRKAAPPPGRIVSGNPPDPNRYAPEGTVWKHVPGLTA